MQRWEVTKYFITVLISFSGISEKKFSKVDFLGFEQEFLKNNTKIPCPELQKLYFTHARDLVSVPDSCQK